VKINIPYATKSMPKIKVTKKEENKCSEKLIKNQE
jgi:hypothetical protein